MGGHRSRALLAGGLVLALAGPVTLAHAASLGGLRAGNLAVFGVSGTVPVPTTTATTTTTTTTTSTSTTTTTVPPTTTTSTTTVPPTTTTTTTTSTSTTTTTQPPTGWACDTFEGVTGTLGGMRSPCGGTWVTTGASWNVADGKVRANGGGGIATVSAARDALVTARILEADRTNAEAGLVLSSTGGASPSYLAAVLVGGTKLQLRYVNGSSTTVLTTVNVTINPALTLAFRRSGTAVTVALDGITRITYNFTTTLNGTGAGMFQGNGQPAFFDAITITPP